MENKAIKTTFQDKAVQVRYPIKEANEKEYCFHCGWHKSKHPGDCKFMSFEKARKKGLLGAKPEGLKMREIKFRARNANLPRCWVYGYFIIEKGTCSIINDDGRFQIIAGTQSQFTGMKDKTGKEIYEGDILKTNDIDGKQNWQVIFERSSVCVGFEFECLTGSFSSCHNEVWDEGIIIGNIYENSELLE